MSESTAQDANFGLDQVMGFTIADRNARGRTVRLAKVLSEIVSAHDYPEGIKRLLAEALVLCALVGSSLKRDGSQLTMQAQTKKGVVELLVCDYRDGELRGYVQFDAHRFSALGPSPALPELFADGYLAVTFDLETTGERYQGIVPLEGNSLAGAFEAYFARSEQIPALIRTAVSLAGDDCIAGGVLVQHLAEGEEGRERLHVQLDHPEWEHVSILAESVTPQELVDPSLPLDELVWRLFHEEREVRVFHAAALSRGCRCSLTYFEQLLARFPKTDRRDMADDNGMIMVDCAFCSRQFAVQD